MDKARIIATNEQAVLLATSLMDIAQQTGLEITITIPPQTEPSAEVETERHDRTILENKRIDLAWLEARLTQYPNEMARLRNHYVAVFNKQVVSIGHNEELVLLGAAASLDVMPDEILVVPVQVDGTDSDEHWLNVKRRLEIA